MAMGFARMFVALDTAKQQEVAIPKYMQAAEALVEFIKVNRNPRLQRSCAEKVQENALRAKILMSNHLQILLNT